MGSTRRQIQSRRDRKDPVLAGLPQEDLRRLSDKIFRGGGSGPGSAAAARAAASAAPRVASTAQTRRKKRAADDANRLAMRIAPSSAAVDALRRSLVRLRSDPSDPRLRSVDTDSAAFRRTFGGVPGVLDFLRVAANYRPAPIVVGSTGVRRRGSVLEMTRYDADAIDEGIAALDRVRSESREYLDDRTRRRFEVEMNRALHSIDEGERERRERILSDLPREPGPRSGGATVRVDLGPSARITRRFDADDVLGDVLAFVGGRGGTEVLSRIESGEWSLVDTSHHGAPALDVGALRGKTLQYVGFWPSARLSVVPTPTADGAGGRGRLPLPSQPRGLGAAPMEALR